MYSCTTSSASTRDVFVTSTLTCTVSPTAIARDRGAGSSTRRSRSSNRTKAVQGHGRVVPIASVQRFPAGKCGAASSRSAPAPRGAASVNGNRPAGLMSPSRADATASPPRWPGYHTSRIAPTFSLAHRRSSGLVDMTIRTTGVPVATIAWSCSNWRPSSASVDREASSPDWTWRSPITTTATSEAAESSTAWRWLRRRRSRKACGPWSRPSRQRRTGTTAQGCPRRARTSPSDPARRPW